MGLANFKTRLGGSRERSDSAFMFSVLPGTIEMRSCERSSPQEDGMDAQVVVRIPPGPHVVDLVYGVAPHRIQHGLSSPDTPEPSLNPRDSGTFRWFACGDRDTGAAVCDIARRLADTYRELSSIITSCLRSTRSCDYVLSHGLWGHTDFADQFVDRNPTVCSERVFDAGGLPSFHPAHLSSPTGLEIQRSFEGSSSTVFFCHEDISEGDPCYRAVLGGRFLHSRHITNLKNINIIGNL